MYVILIIRTSNNCGKPLWLFVENEEDGSAEEGESSECGEVKTLRRV